MSGGSLFRPSDALRQCPAMAAMIMVATMVLAGCVGPEVRRRAQDDEVRVGDWVEIQGRIRDGEPVVEEIERLERKETDRADKLEITAPSESSIGDSLRMLGRDLEITEKTEYEDIDGDPIESLDVKPGDWLRVKTRVRDGGDLRAREIRPVASRRFEVEGELSVFERTAGRLVVGSLALPFPQETRFSVEDPEQIESGSDPLQLFLADERRSVPFTIRPFDNLVFGGQLALATKDDRDRNLDSSRERDRTQYDVELSVDMLWTLDDRGSVLLVEGRFAHEWEFRDNRTSQYNQQEFLSRAFAFVKFSDAFRVQVGRQDFDEEREWLYDEILDGVRASADLGDLEFEVAAAVGREFASIEGNATEDTSTYLALGRYYINDDHWLTAFGIRRTDSSSQKFEPTLFGLRSFSRPGRGFGHWADLAMARGNDGAKRIDGHAFDVGAMYRFQGAWRPTIAGGYAYGLGRDPGGDTVGFRQSGLQDNNSRFGGVTSFKYYGEVFEPELANLEVTTLGFGFRPARTLACDIVAHTYRQDYRSTDLFPNSLRARPNGRSEYFGWEIDLVVGYRYENRVTAEFVAGRFQPGRGFDASDPAIKLEGQVRFKF